jgi:tryptophan synthase alpha chain
MKSSLIDFTFKKCRKEKRPALITFTVAGDNTKKNSLKILNSISKYVDILELSFLHNCPIADGGQIQNSTYRSLENGTTLKDTFKSGENNFIKNCKSSKVDGLIVVDLPWPENKIFAEKCKKKSISFVQLLSPTTSKVRMKKIIKDSHDMIYYISMLSTTGGKLKIPPKKILENYSKIKKINKNKNCVIGFGITNNTIGSFKKADGVVVGSEICKEITKSLKKRQNPVTNVNKMVKKMKDKIL